MKRMLLGTVALLALATAPAVAQQKTVKIGFVSTFSGPVAAIGNVMRKVVSPGVLVNVRSP